ncbi:MAG: glycoside hydrolase family 2 TIM barrel-domain containing protein [Olsenella sp.]
MELDLRRVIGGMAPKPLDVELHRLETPWTCEVERSAHPRPEHPRPQFARARWRSLNGWWDCAVRPCPEARVRWREARPPAEGAWESRIRVPFSPEAPLSGVGHRLAPDELLFYGLTFAPPALAAGERLLLHLDAVDWACAAYLNGARVAEHVGGYLPFSADLTDALRPGENRLELCVFDPSDAGAQLRGKQRIRRGGMWYTAQSGVWRDAWLEVVPAAHLEGVSLAPDPDAGLLRLCVRVRGVGTLRVEVLEGEQVVAVGEVAVGAGGEAGAAGATGAAAGGEDASAEASLEVAVPNPRLWRPEDPFLYGLRLSFGDDEVSSYCAFRTVGVEPDGEGTMRFCLNHAPLFLRGVLDQGYWPDGLMTAPCDEALVADVRRAREAGFNLMRKHVKVESERWYYHCDRLGMLVWQDMVSGGGRRHEWDALDKPTLFRHAQAAFDDRPRLHRWRLSAGDAAYREEWRETAAGTVRLLANHPCVVTWTLFNEGWGQFDARAATRLVRSLDPTRPINAACGWYDQGTGDYHAIHNYFRTMRVYPETLVARLAGARRAFFVSEFGGLMYHVEGHSSLDRAYGYDRFDSEEGWREAARARIEEAAALEGQGLAGFVFTQLSDVEEETNGLLTYDRRLDKLTGERFGDADAGGTAGGDADADGTAGGLG